MEKKQEKGNSFFEEFRISLRKEAEKTVQQKLDELKKEVEKRKEGK